MDKPAVSPTPTAPPAATPAPQPEPPKAADPWTLPTRQVRPPRPPAPGDAQLVPWEAAAKTKFAPPPPNCAAWAKRAPATPAPSDVQAAMAESDPAKRDAALVALEAKYDKVTPGVVRALRADLAPVECADVIVDPLLVGKKTVSGTVGHTLVGLSVAGKLARTGLGAPKMPATKEKAKLREFIGGPLKNWLADQATAIQMLSTAGSALAGFGRGVAAIEAGTAELRLVDTIRSAPVPKEWDAELKQVYEIALDEALEPRKARGRDAALLGLAEMANEGILYDSRVDRARAILAKMYGGRRIDALDALLLPPVAAPARFESPFWMPLFGVAVPPKDDPAAAARRSLDLGRRYWWRLDFVDAAYSAKDANDRLVLALALALAEGPGTALDMMKASSPAALNLTHTGALDALVAEGGASAAMAAFDAAYLRSLSPPDADAGPYWKDVAARFRKAASLLTDPADKKKAEDRANDADAAAAAGEKK